MSEVLDDSLFMRSVRRQPVPRRPVWLMRQAGRYLPEYRSVRSGAGGFLDLVKTPELACKVTLQPIDRFGFDAAIIFSDILIVPDAMRLGLHFVEGEGPRLTAPLRDEAAVNALPTPDPEAFRYLYDAIRLTRESLPPATPLIGFCGAPFTLACYMIDGGGGAFWQTRVLRHRRPDLLGQIVDKTATVAAHLLIEQVRAGCQTVMIFDSWGGLLTDEDYVTFSLPAIARMVAAVKAATAAPVIVFGRQCGLSLSHIAACGCDVVGVDWQTAPATARRLAGPDLTLQGNLDPAALLTDPETVAERTRQTLEAFNRAGGGHIFNLGHGVDKRTPPENVAALVEAVRGYSLN